MISWADRVRNEAVLGRVKEEINILQKKAKKVGIFRRNCLLRHVTEGNIQEMIEVTGRRGIRRKQLLGDLKEKRGYSKFKQKVPDRTL